MDTSIRTEEKRVIEVNGVEFSVEKIAGPLGWLRRGKVDDELVNSAVLRRMADAGLVQQNTSGGLMSMEPDSEQTTEWVQVGGRCKDLFEQLNEPYARLRPKIDTTETGPFGMWDEMEDEDARKEAEAKVEELNERNPDVEFYLDEEELSHIPE
jgi:hypothetical protein